MAKATKRFTDLGVKKLAKTPGVHHDGGGLYLLVRKPPSTAASWSLKWMQAGSSHSYGLGPYPAVGLSKARAKASAALELIKGDRINPIETEGVKARARAAKAAVSLTDCAALFVKDHANAWRGKRTKDQWESRFKAYIEPVIGKRPVAEIGTDDVARVLKAPTRGDDGKLATLWEVKNNTAGYLRMQLQDVLDYAVAAGCRPEGSPNPARMRGNLDRLLVNRGKRTAKIESFKAIPMADIPAFMAKVREQSTAQAKGLEFLILTCTRPSETREATFAEIDFDAKTWTIPETRRKSDRVDRPAGPHRVPLSDRALAILREQRAATDGDYIFPGAKAGQPFSENQMQNTMKALGYQATPHGTARAGFRSWAADQQISFELAELVLGHAQRDATVKAYQRSDALEPRRVVMQRWADALAGKAPAGAANLDKARRARRAKAA